MSAEKAMRMARSIAQPRRLPSDDGVGGARLEGSSGLLGLEDRAAALDGELRVESPPGGGTVITATLPVPTT
jgi:nitrate/nitrite-specific signal transduction histidine kinase